MFSRIHQRSLLILAFCLLEMFYYCYHLLLVIILRFGFFVIQSWQVFPLGVYSFLLSCQICWHIIGHSSLLQSSVFLQYVVTSSLSFEFVLRGSRGDSVGLGLDHCSKVTISVKGVTEIFWFPSAYKSYAYTVLQFFNSTAQQHYVLKIDTYLNLKMLHCLIIKLCSTLCDPMDCSPPGPSVHGISPARIMEWVAVSSPILKILNW